MNLKQLPYIIAIEEAGNLSGAARNLNISQPTLTLYLKELESETGITLFTKVKKRLVPTPAGRLYIDTARQILSINAQTINSIRRLDMEPTQILVFGTAPNRGSNLLAKLIPDVALHYPSTQLIPVEARSVELMRMLLKNKVVFGISASFQVIDDRLVIQAITEEELLLGVSSYRASYDKKINSIEDLPYANLEDYKDDWFGYSYPDSGLQKATEALLELNHFVPDKLLGEYNPELLRSLISAGSCVGFLPSHYMEGSENVTFFRVKPRIATKVGIVMKKDHEMTEAERYICYLQTLNIIKEHRNDLSKINRTPFYARLFREFDPEMLKLLNMEDLI